MMKTLIVATALSLAAGAAFAGEGQGNPFPFNAPPISVSTQGITRAPSVTQNPFPYTTPGLAVNSNPVLPTMGSEGPVQTASSLPVGFENGTPAAAAPVPASPTRLAQPIAAATHG